MARSGPFDDSAAVPAYTRTAVLFHWLLAAALVAEFALGWWMEGVPKTPPGVRAGWFNLHKSIGLTIALLVIVRLAWRVTHAVAVDDRMPPWQAAAARWTHRLLYACMVVMPLSGYLGSTFTRYPVRYFGLVLPSWNVEWPAAKELMAVTHEAAAWLFAFLVVLHASAALWHWWRGDAVAARMRWPASSGA